MVKANQLSETAIKDLVWNRAKEIAGQGAGYAQEGVLMRQLAEELSIDWDEDIQVQHWILDAWHDLFATKKLGWGLNLDNPGAPFFHLRVSE